VKLMIASDLHADLWRAPEFWGQDFSGLKDTKLVLAGDIFSLRPFATDALKADLELLLEAFEEVVYVPGNHEYYGTSPYRADEALNQLEEEYEHKGLCILRNQHGGYADGSYILGGTMWIPKVPAGTPPINDSFQIRNFSPWYYEEHERFKAFLEDSLQPGDVVITHHCPSLKSVPTRYENDPCNPWFVAPEMEKLILERKPKLWIHGHTHTSFDYMLGETRVICNPLGYRGEGQSERFNPRLIVEV
jgi:predicted phosphodiesterase